MAWGGTWEGRAARSTLFAPAAAPQDRTRPNRRTTDLAWTHGRRTADATRGATTARSGRMRKHIRPMRHTSQRGTVLTMSANADGTTDGEQDKNSAAIPLDGGLTAHVRPVNGDADGVHLTVVREGLHPAAGGMRAIVDDAARTDPDAATGERSRVATRSRGDIGPTVHARTPEDARRLVDAIRRLA